MFLALPVQTEVDICGVSIYYCVNRKAFVKSVSYSYLHVHNVPHCVCDSPNWPCVMCFSVTVAAILATTMLSGNKHPIYHIMYTCMNVYSQ